MTPSLAPAMVALLEGPLDSFEKLDVAWHASCGVRGAALVQATHLEHDAMHRAIEELVVAGILADATTMQLGERGREADVAALLALYGEDRPAVAAALSAIAVARIRDLARHTFSDALVRDKKARKK